MRVKSRIPIRGNRCNYFLQLLYNIINECAYTLSSSTIVVHDVCGLFRNRYLGTFNSVTHPIQFGQNPGQELLSILRPPIYLLWATQHENNAI